MPKKISKTQILKKAEQFVNANTNAKLEALLKLNKSELSLIAFAPQYYFFKMRKTNGGYRDIEAPELNLKIVQRKLNEYLQCVYYTIMPDAAYGFVINPRRQKPKNIVTNAQLHLGCKYLINIDFDDFFHQISNEEVRAIFSKPPFKFQKNTVNTLVKICTHKGRLPMGAPTSPVLSNIACINMDKELKKWADINKIIYTRFVDDLSFSSHFLVEQDKFNEILQITDKYEFKIGPEKTKRFGPQQEKTVTGLVVDKQINIPPDYYDELDKDLLRLQKSAEVHIITGQVYNAGAIKKFKQAVTGKINFIATVLGYDNEKYYQYLEKYETAVNPPQEELSLRWTKFNNYVIL